MFSNTIKYYAPLGGDKMPLLTIENCEEYLLLYIDNELSDTVKHEVENFIENNKVAKTLLAQLKQTILDIDTTDIDKIELYKTAQLDEYNFEKAALLYIDGELGTNDKQYLESYVAQNELAATQLANLQKVKLNKENISINKFSLQKINHHAFDQTTSIATALNMYIDKELNSQQTAAIKNLSNADISIKNEIELLQQLVLPKEKIVFPNKEALLKIVSKEKPIIPLWMRYAAAAVFVIGVSVFGINTISNKKNNHSSIASKKQLNNTLELPYETIGGTNKTIVITPKPNNQVESNEKISIKKDVVSVNVKNALSKNNAVTFQQVHRTTDTNNITTVLIYKEETIDANPALVAWQNTTEKKEIEIDATIAGTTLLQQVNNQSFPTYTSNKEVHEASNISILAIPLEKINGNATVAKGKNKLKAKWNQLIKNIKEEIKDSDATIGGAYRLEKLIR